MSFTSQPFVASCAPSGAARSTSASCSSLQLPAAGHHKFALMVTPPCSVLVVPVGSKPAVVDTFIGSIAAKWPSALSGTFGLRLLPFTSRSMAIAMSLAWSRFHLSLAVVFRESLPGARKRCNQKQQVDSRCCRCRPGTLPFSSSSRALAQVFWQKALLCQLQHLQRLRHRSRPAPGRMRQLGLGLGLGLLRAERMALLRFRFNLRFGALFAKISVFSSHSSSEPKTANLLPLLVAAIEANKAHALALAARGLYQ